MKGYEIAAWNDAKKYIVEIIHPLLADHLRYSQITLYGAASLEEARQMPRQQRYYERFNALKGMIGTTLIICDEIYSTVALRKKQEQIQMLEEISKKLNEVLDFIEENPDYFFVEGQDGNILDGSKLKEFRDYDVKCYKNINKIMTLNNLLFKGDFDEISQEDLIEELREEFLEA